MNNFNGTYTVRYRDKAYTDWCLYSNNYIEANIPNFAPFFEDYQHLHGGAKFKTDLFWSSGKRENLFIKSTEANRAIKLVKNKQNDIFPCETRLFSSQSENIHLT